MNGLKSSLVLCSIISVLFSQKAISGVVIIVNRCHEPLGIVHVKDIKGKKKYNGMPIESKGIKLIEVDKNKPEEKDKTTGEAKKVKVKKDRDCGYKKIEKLEKDELFKVELKPGDFLILRNVDFANNEKVYVKGMSWKRLKGTKAHYKSLHLKEGDHIVFLDKSVPGIVYGGKIDRKPIKIESKMSDLISKLNYVYSDIIPFIKELSDLGDENLKDRAGLLEKDLEKLENFKGALKNNNITKENYKDLIDKIELLDLTIKVILKKEKPEVEIEKKVKNIKQEELFGYMATVRSMLSPKIDLEKFLDSHKSDQVKSIGLVAKYMDLKGEIYNKEGKARIEEIIGKCNWMVAKRNVQIKQ